jgi:hypothetical protein
LRLPIFYRSLQLSLDAGGVINFVG